MKHGQVVLCRVDVPGQSSHYSLAFVDRALNGGCSHSLQLDARVREDASVSAYFALENLFQNYDDQTPERFYASNPELVEAAINTLFEKIKKELRAAT